MIGAPRLGLAAGVVLLVAAGCGGGGGGGSTAKPRPVATTSTTTVRPPAQVKVFVLNGAGIQGAAAAKANQLRLHGYTVVGIGNAPHQQGTVVACRTGLVNESAQLATAVGPGTAIVPFPAPEPAGVSGADCIVGLGR